MGAWTSGSSGRTSTWNRARRTTWTVRGLAMDRCIRATQRRNRSSSARLGMAVVIGSAVPQVSSTREMMASACSGGIPMG